MKLPLGLACLFLMIASSPAAETLAVGDTAPDFSLQGSDGKTYALKDFKDNQVVVVAWFPKAFTGGCTKQCESLRESSALLKGFDVAYFTASCDQAEDNKKFAEQLGLDYPILSDPEKTTAKAYGVVTDERPYPHRWTFYIGKDGKILYIDRKVDVKTYGEIVAEKLTELKVAKKKAD